MGILNVTPDSFSDGGLYFQHPKKIIARVQEMLQQGADIIDVGGESTRPGSERVSESEELSRTVPVIQAIRKHVGDTFPISIDTNKSIVAREALKSGAAIVNSLGGMRFDPHLADVIAEFNCLFIIYHIKGLPRTMQKGNIEYTDVIGEISTFFKEQIRYGMKKGIQKNQFILDPGIGFGKTVEQNIEIIKNLDKLKEFHLPILIGVSRKSHLGKLLQVKLTLSDIPSPQERLEASLAETAIAIKNGATIIRTHDVSQTKRFITTLEELL